MQFFGQLVSKLSSVGNLFSNPYRVREVPLAEYASFSPCREDGRIVLYHNTSARSWDCLLVSPQHPQNAFRIFQLDTEAEATQRFDEFSQKLRPFYESVRQGLTLDVIQQLTDCIRSHPTWSLAHVAVDTGQTESFRHNKILRSVNSTDGENGCTPLHLACQKGDVECIRELVEQCNARKDIADSNGETVFHYAAKQNDPRITEILAQNQSNCLNQLSNSGETPLHVACRLGKSETLKALLRFKAKPDIVGKQGLPIHTAMKYNQKVCAEALLDVDVNQVFARDTRYGATPLHWVKNVEMTRLLLARGSNINYVSKTGDTALHIMVKRSRFDCAMVLLTHGADANAQGDGGNTPLHLAMKLDHLELIKALIVFGANVETPNEFGETPGLIAARSSKGANRKVLLSLLSSVGAERCYPPSPDSSPALYPHTSRSSNSSIGFGDAVYIATGLTAMMGMGQDCVDSSDGLRRCDRVLCLDGGGIRGLVLIQLLLAIEQAAGRPVRELFDWISGTSTGGILALAIVHGKSMEYLRCLYFRMKDEVFKGSRPYESAPLEEFLKREFGEDTKMTDVRRPRVMVTGVLADRHPAELHLFRNYDPPQTGKDPPYQRVATFQPITAPEHQLVWRAARSSGAAPTYFRPNGRFLDGGLLANNPTLDSLVEIHEFNKDLRRKCTDADGPSVERARAWCEMMDASYFRLSPQLQTEVMLDEVSDSILVNMLWETQIYVYHHRELFQSLVQKLLS
ncbi:85/88 kDa calcium-independent phospholipase A2 isoform X3 [Lissotriton helveticus]